MSNLVSLIRQAAGTDYSNYTDILQCNVQSINIDDLTCVCIAISGKSTGPITQLDGKVTIIEQSFDGQLISNEGDRQEVNSSLNDLELNNVALMQGINDGFLIIPKINSQVLVIYSNNHQPAVIQYSEVEKIFMTFNTVPGNPNSPGQWVEYVFDGINGFNLDFNNSNTILNISENEMNYQTDKGNTFFSITKDSMSYTKSDDSLSKLVQDLITLLETQTFPTPSGMSSVTANVSDFQQLAQRAQKLIT